MTNDPSLLALRLFDQDHALEPGRNYLLGAGRDCDFQVLLEDVAPQHLRLAAGPGGVEVTDLGSATGTLRNGFRIDRATLAIGDAIQFGKGVAVVTRDDGDARIVPIPELRNEADLRRMVAAAPPLPKKLARTAPPPLPASGQAVGAGTSVTVPTGTVRRFEEQNFVDTVAHEMRRAPWFVVSFVLHFILIVLLIALYPAPEISGDAIATVNIDLAGSRVTTGEAPVTPPEVVVEEDEPTIEIDDPVEPPPVIEEQPLEPEKLGQLTANPRISKRPPSKKTDATKTTSRHGDIAGVGSAGFQKTVADLQESGLEIVFVFDSTGSMGVTIRDTKNTISEMLHVLRALVPDSRVGLVTFRDRGRGEDYVVREIPLGFDFWQASNFVQGVRAEGGGDRAEAVRDGLRSAFQQSWRRKSKRVVVLAGDAPAHRRDWQRLMQEVKSFAARGNSFVYTLVTSPDDAGDDTHQQFQKIAKAGKGECLSLDDHEEVLKRVLDFAFGRQFDGDLTRVREVLRSSAGRTSTWALDVSRRGGSDLEVALRRQPVDPELLNALVRLPKRKVVEQLIRILAFERTPPHTRQAVAWVLQRVFDLEVPPVDPATGAPPPRRTINEITRRARRLRN